VADIPAIETRYKGHRFRSRLEARWAVFLDDLPIKYIYELEGFKLKGGLRYLPDFFLPDVGIYVEVKPTRKIDLQSFRKIVAFAYASEGPLLLLIGVPSQEEILLMDGYGNDLQEFDVMVAEHGKERAIEIVLELCSRGRFSRDLMDKEWTLVRDEDPPPSEWDLQSAKRKALSARFEHGEQG
jgi:hypothetical protein